MTATDANLPTAPVFAHASEAELARILDYYQVEWRYEPRTFPILFNLEGAVVESFAPDFYLPEFDLYVELTTLKQSLVRKKNRKLRRLRELYPDVRIKLFYARDFKALLLKYGRFDLASSLSGEEGQARHGEAASASDGVAIVDDASRSGEQLGTSTDAATPRPDDDAAAIPVPVAPAASAGAARHGRSRRARRRRRAATVID
ncbi:MAG TPA: hypothetical protein VMT36_04760 [Candidatus Saccharimonadia bacterium]|nr:hypothetical protein [Candidatus Saccharimonadia bacterium]